MSDANNILPSGPGDAGKQKLSEERLMAWLAGDLSHAEQHEVEQWLADEGMESDAMEGLRELKPAETKQVVNKLNSQLRKTVSNKKHKRRSRQPDQFTWVAIAIILLLAIVAYIVIRKTI